VTTAEKYVTAAYLAVFVVVLVYLLIIGLKLMRLEREVADLEQRARQRPEQDAEKRKAVAVG